MKVEREWEEHGGAAKERGGDGREGKWAEKRMGQI